MAIIIIQTPADLWKRVDRSKLYPRLGDMVQETLENCVLRGALYYPTSGLRTWAEQDALYAQGRTKPGSIVTKAKGGESNHNYGTATDCTKDMDAQKAGLQPGWNLEDYRILAEEAAKVGLEPAFYWKSFKEGPHLQLPLEKNGLSFHKLRDIYLVNGLAGVFAELDKHTW